MLTRKTLEDAIPIVRQRYQASGSNAFERTMVYVRYDTKEIARNVGLESCTRGELGILDTFVIRYASLLLQREGDEARLKYKYNTLQRSPVRSSVPEMVIGGLMAGIGYALGMVVFGIGGMALAAGTTAYRMRRHKKLKRELCEPQEVEIGKLNAQLQNRTAELVTEQLKQFAQQHTYWTSPVPLAQPENTG